MKTNYLFTCCILLVLSSSGILLTEISSTAQNGQNGEKPSSSSSSTADKKIAEPKPGEGITQSLETPSNTSNNPASVSPVIPAASNEVRGVKANGDDASPISWLTGGFGLLHLLEIAGMVWAYIKINQLSEKSRDSRSQIRSLTDRLSASEQKQKSQADQLKSIGSEAVNARNLTARMNAIEQASSQQKYSGDVGYANPGYSLSSPEAAAPIQSEYPFLDTYRQSSDNFKNKYAPKIVSEDADNLQKRRAGDYQEIILGEDRQGNYWLFNDGSTTYLIPSPKLKVNDLNIRTAGALFTCENYTPGYQHVSIVRPAIVSSQLGANERWKLEQKGVLEFT